MSHSWLNSLVSDGKRHALPILTSPGMALIGAGAAEVFRSGELQFQAVQALVGRFPMAAAMTMMDLSVEAEAFGAPVQFSEQENPNITGAVLHDLTAVDQLHVPQIGSHRTGEVLFAARRCAAEIKDRPTLGGMIGPFSLCGRLYEMSKMMLATMTEPEPLHRLLQKATDFLVEYALAFRATGCHGLIMAEPAAGLISPKMADQFSYRYIRQIVDAVSVAGRFGLDSAGNDDFVFILHNCGKTEKMLAEMTATGASALHLGNAIDITNALRQVELPVMGNIDPSSVFLLGTPDAVFQKTSELLRATSQFPHFVLSSGCDIPPMTPIANITAFFDALDEYNG